MIQNKLIAYSSRRSGGREARRNLRAAPLAEDLRPIRAGLEGGNLNPWMRWLFRRLMQPFIRFWNKLALAKRQIRA